MDSNLRDALAALSRARGLTAPAGPEAAAPLRAGAAPLDGAPARPAPKSAALEKILPGEEIGTPSGRCWRHTRELSRWPGTDPHLAERLKDRLREAPPSDLQDDSGVSLWRLLGFEKGLFLDLETTGLAATPVFLAGLLGVYDGEMKFVLYFARSYAEEKSLLEAVAAEIERRPVVITYNGKSYDLPFLGERNGRLRVGRPAPGAVLDLLHPARRRWRHRFPDCRLKTLERGLCARHRGADVDGRDIPDLYHRYVRDQDARRLLPIFSHNIVDLYTLLDITERVLSTEPVASPSGTSPANAPGAAVRR